MPVDYANYPKNWKAIVAAVRERSGDCCEGSPAWPSCRIPNGAVRDKDDRDVSFLPDVDYGLEVEAWFCDRESRMSIVVLTVGHLDHDASNPDIGLDRLRHWCQRCHNTYDAPHRAQTRYMKARDNGTREMFDL